MQVKYCNLIVNMCRTHILQGFLQNPTVRGLCFGFPSVKDLWETLKAKLLKDSMFVFSCEAQSCSEHIGNIKKGLKSYE